MGHKNKKLMRQKQMDRACLVSDLILSHANHFGYLDHPELCFLVGAARDMNEELALVEEGLQKPKEAICAIDRVIAPFMIMAVERALCAGFYPQQLTQSMEYGV